MSARGKGPRPYPRPPQLTEREALAFVLTWRPVIAGMLLRRGVPAHDVADYSQEILIIAWNANKEGRLAVEHPPAVRAWIRSVVLRLTIRPFHQRARTVLVDVLDIAAREDDAEGPALARDLLRELQDSTTPERWRVLVMHAQGMTHEEIATVEHAPPATIHTRLRLARRDLQAAIVRERARETGPTVPRQRPPRGKNRSK